VNADGLASVPVHPFLCIADPREAGGRRQKAEGRRQEAEESRESGVRAEGRRQEAEESRESGVDHFSPIPQ